MTTQPTAGDGAHELLDSEALSKVRQLGGAALLGRLIAMFLENAPVRLARAVDGIAAGDMVAVERAAHSLKSTAGNLGARRLQFLAEEVEGLAAAGDAAAAGPLLAGLSVVYEETKEALILEREGRER